MVKYLIPERAGLTGKKPNTKRKRPTSWIRTAATESAANLEQPNDNE